MRKIKIYKFLKSIWYEIYENKRIFRSASNFQLHKKKLRKEKTEKIRKST